MPFWDTILDTVISNAPQIIGTAGDIIGNQQVTDGNNAAAAAVGQGYAEANDIYQDAYDEALGYQLDALGLDAETEAARLQDILPFIASLRDDYATGARASGINYGDMLAAGAQDYAGALQGGGQLAAIDMLSGGELFAGDMEAASDRFGTSIGEAASDYAGTIGAGADDYDAAISGGFRRADRMYQPYSEEGLNALDLLRGITARGADELDPSQRRMRDRSIEDMRANLAASGLRGAGRAGVAVMNEGIADLDANIFDSNQARRDRAIDTLASLGFGATGQRSSLATGEADRLGQNDRWAAERIGGNNMSAAQLAAGTRMSADDLAARTRLDTMERASDRMYDANREGAGRIYDATRDAATGAFNIDDAILRNDATRGDQALDLLNNFYTGRTTRGLSEAGARTWGTMGQADSAATAAAGTQFARGQAEAGNARSNAATTGSVASTLGNIFRNTTRDTKAPTFASAT